MTVQLSTPVRNAMLDAIETVIGTGALFKIFTGSQPANCATADSGTKLAELTLPSDWLANATGGTKSKSGTWSGTAIAGAGATPGYYRITDSGGTTCGEQGDAAIGSGSLNFDGTITSGQTVTISTFVHTAGNP